MDKKLDQGNPQEVPKRPDALNLYAAHVKPSQPEFVIVCARRQTKRKQTHCNLTTSTEAAKFGGPVPPEWTKPKLDFLRNSFEAIQPFTTSQPHCQGANVACIHC